ncbi:hypothetical protein HK096_000529, partial [Nowakowskiella sp. JEL0078]
MSSQATLKYLAWLEPDLILPKFLDIAYPALESLTETHRTLCILSTLSNISTPLIRRSHFPQGAKHIVPLLHLALPGIDMNDPTKSLSSLMFISNTVSQLPLVDLTRLPPSNQKRSVNYQNRVIERTKENVMQGLVDDGVFGDLVELTVDLEYEDEVVCSSTAGIEEWVVEFWNRVFKMFENLPENYATNQKKGTIEQTMMSFVIHTSESVIAQLSPELAELSRSKIFQFMNSNVIPNATKSIGSLISQFTSGDAKESLRTFFSFARSRIIAEIAQGSGSESTSISSNTGHPYNFATMSDASLHWWQSIINGLVDGGGVELLAYQDDLISLIVEMAKNINSATGYKWTGKLIRNILDSLLQRNPIEQRSIKPDLWTNVEYMSRSHREWGEPINRNDIGITWHIPTQKEIDFAESLITVVGGIAVSNLQMLMRDSTTKELSNSKKKEFGNGFTKWITILQDIIRGSAILARDETKANINATVIEDEENDPSLIFTFKGIYAIDDPNSPQARRVVDLRLKFVILLEKLFNFLQRHLLDEVDPQKALVEAIKSYFSERGVDSTLVDNRDGFLKYRKSILRNVPSSGQRSLDIVIPGVLTSQNKANPMNSYDRELWQQHIQQKKTDSYSRSILIRDIYQLHQKRVAQNGVLIGSQSQLHWDLLDVILSLSVDSRFAAIRSTAQNAFKAISKNWSGSKKVVVPKLLDFLKPIEKNGNSTVKKLGIDEVAADKMKGALYLLQIKGLKGLILTDWTIKKKFALNVVLSQHMDKPSIQELVRKLFIDFIVNTWDAALEYQISDFAMNVANDIITREIYVHSVKNLQYSSEVRANIEKLRLKADLKVIKSKEAYSSMMNELLELNQSGSLHWRFSAMSINFMEFMMSIQIPVSADLAHFVTKTANNELPAIRQIAIQSLGCILTILKSRAHEVQKRIAKGLVNDDGKLYSRVYKNITVFPRPERKEDVESFLIEGVTMIKSAEQWERTIFVDSSSEGFLLWSQNRVLMGTKTPSDNSAWTLPYIDYESISAIISIQAVLLDPEWWSAHIKYISQELSTPEHGESFNHSIQKLHETIFTFFEDSFLYNEDIGIIRHISDLMSCKPDELSKQHSAAAVLAGIVRGSLNWNYKQVTRLWEWVLPIIERAFISSTPESNIYWIQFVAVVTSERDLRRVFPLVNLILNSRLDPNSKSFFAEAKKLSLVRQILSAYSWRLNLLVANPTDENNLLISYFENIWHPYNQVRELIGGAIDQIATNVWNVSAPNVEYLLSLSRKAEESGNALQSFNQDLWLPEKVE